MSVSAGLRKYGFRRWYERQLYESHAYLVTAFLSLILVATAAEVYVDHETVAQKVLVLVLAAAAAVLCLFAWRRFSALLFRAEALATQATCERCRAYGKFDVIGASSKAGTLTGERVNVRCRKCSCEWVLG
jgi:hypothetical protein